MRALLRKELRALLPVYALLAALVALEFAFELATSPPDQRPISVAWEDYAGHGSMGAVLSFLLAFAISGGLLARESEEGTLAFLDALPTTRSRVFLAKFAAGMGALLALPLGSAARVAALQALSRDSLDPALHLGPIAAILALRACQGFVFLSAGMALSFLRRLGWLIAALAFWGYFALKSAAPWIAALNVFALDDPLWRGQALELRAAPLAAQLAMGAAFFALAWGLFAGAGEALLARMDSMKRGPWGSAALALVGAAAATLLGAIVVVGLSHRGGVVGPPVDPVDSKFAEWSSSRLATRRYEFIYPSNLEARARSLAERADAVHDRVRDFLGATDGVPIVADLTARERSHAGSAYWNKIRMNLADSDDPVWLAAVLGHETAHVFASRLTRSRINDAFDSTRFFNEGLASYLEFRLFRPEGSVEGYRRAAGILRTRGEIRIEELVDRAKLMERQDPDMVYAAGESFVAATVKLYGDGAPGKLLRALGREGGPRNLAGLELWRDAFQAAGYDLDAAIDEFFALLDASARENRGLASRLPRIRPEVSVGARRATIRVTQAPPPGWAPICRFRAGPRVDPREYRRAEEDGAGEFSIPRAALPPEGFGYQVGWADGSGDIAIYEPWARVAPVEDVEAN